MVGGPPKNYSSFTVAIYDVANSVKRNPMPSAEQRDQIHDLRRRLEQAKVSL